MPTRTINHEYLILLKGVLNGFSIRCFVIWTSSPLSPLALPTYFP